MVSPQPSFAQASPPAPYFSIITVCRNAEATIKNTTASLLAQDCPNWEWLVVDGASTDETTNLIRAMAHGDARLTLTSEPDQGIFDAMNKGIARAKGEFLYFLNADDQLADAGVLTDVSAYLREHPQADFVYGDIIVESADGKKVLYQSPSARDALSEMVCGSLPHQGSFARRVLFATDRSGLFDQAYRYGGDYLWMMNTLTDPATQWAKMDRVIAHFFDGGNSSALAACLPESHGILNRHHAFRQALGEEGLRLAYQKEILALRLELQVLRTDAARQLNARQDLKTKLEKAKGERDQFKQSLKNRPARPAARFSWWPAWLRF